MSLLHSALLRIGVLSITGAVLNFCFVSLGHGSEITGARCVVVAMPGARNFGGVSQRPEDEMLAGG